MKILFLILINLITISYFYKFNNYKILIKIFILRFNLIIQLRFVFQIVKKIILYMCLLSFHNRL